MLPGDDEAPPSPALSNPPTEGLPSPSAPTGGGPPAGAGEPPPPDAEAYGYNAPPGSEEPIRVLVRVSRWRLDGRERRGVELSKY